jgi:hypothetical protein
VGKTGQASQESFNCDYITVTRNGYIQNLNTVTINNKSISNLIRDSEECLEIRKQIFDIKRDMKEIRKIMGPVGFSKGRQVCVQVHFEDIDLKTINVENFQNDIVLSFSSVSNRTEEDILLINVRDEDRSTLVSVEIYFKGIDEEKESNDFLTILNSGHIDSFDKILGVYSYSHQFNYRIEFSVGPIQSTNAKVDNFKKTLDSPDLLFQNSQSIVLGEYKLKSSNGALLIQRYDEEQGVYVGGTIITDV